MGVLFSLGVLFSHGWSSEHGGEDWQGKALVLEMAEENAYDVRRGVERPVDLNWDFPLQPGGCIPQR